MTSGSAKGVLGRFAGPVLWVLTALGAFGAAPALGQATQLIVSGTLVIDGGGSDTGYTLKYSGVLVQAGTATQVIRLSPQHPTLVVRGNGKFGDSCSIGADCFSTDICGDGVCGWTGIEVAQGCGDPTALGSLDATFDDCVRIWAVPNPANVTARADLCMRAGSKLWGGAAVVSATCPQLQQYRDGFDLMFTNGGARGSVLNKAIQQGVPTALTPSMGDPALDGQRVGEIQGVLKVIDSWFRTEVARYGTSSDPTVLAATSATTGMFFKSVFTDEVIGAQPPPISDSDAATIEDRIQRSGFVADKQVLRAAYSPEMPLRTAPLLYVTADALQGLSDRTVSFSRVQDIACRFRPCSPGRTSVGNYMKLLGSIADKDVLATAIALAGTNPRTGDPDTRATEWTPVFSLVQAQHAALENAVLSATERAGGYSTDTLLTDPVDAAPAYLVPLANIIRPALGMSNAFENTGTFRPRPRSLVVGLDQDRNAKLRAEVDRLCSDTTGVIPTAVRAYQSNERDYITEVLNVAQNGSAIDKAERQIDEIAQRYGDLSADMAGLRGSRQGEEITYGSLMQSFEALAPAINDVAQRFEVTHGHNDVNLSGADARFDPTKPVPVNIQDVVARDATGAVWKLPANPGDMLNFAFSGHWAPTCALRNMDDPNGGKISVSQTGGGDVLTGPEGYSISVSGSKTHATSNSQTEGVEAWTSERLVNEACAGGGWDFIFTAKAKACSYLEVGSRQYISGVKSDTTTGSSLSSFTWARGIRSPETPFPDEPTGSLLLVELPGNDTDPRHIRSVRVLTSPQSSVLVPPPIDGGVAASDYYLVVNDKSCSPVGNDALGIQVSHLQPAGALSAALAQAMATSQKELRDTAQTYVAQGQLLQGQRDLLRAQALNRVYQLSGQPNMSIFAESLRNLFDMFVNKEIVDIEREIQMVSIERQMRSLTAEEDSIEIDIASHQVTSRVDSLLGGLSLRNLDLTELESHTGEASDLLRDWMEPVVNLRINGSLTFTQADKILLDRVISLSPGGKYVDNLGVACPAVNLLTTKLTNDAIANPTPVAKTVILSIPNPYGMMPGPDYRPVNSAISQLAWDSLVAGGDLDLAVTPSMFYENKEPYSLQCTLSAPVVTSMLYYLVMPPLTASETFTSETTTVLPDMLFPRGNELYAYTFENGLYLMPPVPILSGGVESRTVFDQIIGDGGSAWSTPLAQSLPNRGTSPFATYHLDLSRLRNTYTNPDGTLSDLYPFKQALSLLVAFRVEAISQAPNNVLPGVPPCDPYP